MRHTSTLEEAGPRIWAEEPRLGRVRKGSPHQQLNQHAAGGNVDQRLLSSGSLFDLLEFLVKTVLDHHLEAESGSGRTLLLESASTLRRELYLRLLHFPLDRDSNKKSDCEHHLENRLVNRRLNQICFFPNGALPHRTSLRKRWVRRNNTSSWISSLRDLHRNGINSCCA